MWTVVERIILTEIVWKSIGFSFLISDSLKIISELHEVNPIYKDSREFDPGPGVLSVPYILVFQCAYYHLKEISRISI